MEKRTYLSIFTISLISLKSLAAEKPNIVVVFSDQLAPWALSCYGSTEIQTPNIDKLARDGVRFNNAYCVKAVSTPSRGSMLTGLYPFAHEAENNQALLNTSVETYADVLNANGYQTGYVGKWHLAGQMGPNNDPRWNPDINGGFKDATYMYNNGHWKNIVERQDTTPLVSTSISANPDEYGTDWLFNKGFDYIDKHKCEPFALVISPPDPHPGLKVRTPYNTMFNTANMSIPSSFYPENIINQSIFTSVTNPSALKQDKTQYLGMVKCIDDYIGKLVEKLKADGIYDNTIIILTADHGEMMGAHARMGKAIPFNEAYNIPFIISCPKMFSAKIIDQLYSNIDFKPTLLGLLGLTESANHGVDKSFLIKGTAPNNNADNNIFIDFAKGGSDEDEGVFPHVGMITADYWFAMNLSTIGNQITGVRETLLFDRKNDPFQLKNLSGLPEFAAIEKEMKEAIHQEFKRVNHSALYLFDVIEEQLKLKPFFTETFGTQAPLLAQYASGIHGTKTVEYTNYSNQLVSFESTDASKLSIVTPSKPSDCTDASGGSALYFGQGSASAKCIIKSINTTQYDSIKLSYNIFKGTGTVSNISVRYSENSGAIWNLMTNTGSIATSDGWGTNTSSTLLPSTQNLWLEFGVSSQYTFIDDIILKGISKNQTDVASYLIPTIKVYPMPCTDQVHVNCLLLQKIELYNTLGALLLKTNEPIINTSILSPGTYLLKIYHNNGIENKVIIKQ